MEYDISFPKDLVSFKQFVSDHLFNMDKIDDEICTSIIGKITGNNFKFSDEEIGVMQGISKIGDVCTCDCDHRIGPDKRILAYSKV